jgi:putative oxidoreductase
MSSVQGVLSVVGRLFLCAIFLMSAANDLMRFNDTTAMMAKVGVPQPPILLTGAIVFLIVGGVSVVLGFQARVGALLLFVFLVLATYYFHDFWNVNRDRMVDENKEFAILTDEAIQKQVTKEQIGQMLNVMKNLGLMGAMLFIMANGAGHWSVDAYRVRKPGTTPAS